VERVPLRFSSGRGVTFFTFWVFEVQRVFFWFFLEKKWFFCVMVAMAFKPGRKYPGKLW
jgi:hypothetical protein